MAKNKGKNSSNTKDRTYTGKNGKFVKIVAWVLVVMLIATLLPVAFNAFF